jgi:hypothetical protein
MAVGRKFVYPITNEEAGGIKNCTNDTFTTEYQYVPGTLTVYFDSITLLKDYDFRELPDYQSFQILIDPSDRRRLNKLPKIGDKLWVGYFVQ